MPPLTDSESAEAIRSHHSELQAALRKRVAALTDTVRAGHGPEPARAAVLEFLDTELLPHAAAEERSIYPAGDRGATAMLVRAMVAEHRNLVAHVAGLRQSSDAIEAMGFAREVQALFESHLSKENDLLLPVLMADPSVSLANLLSGMHEILG
jgi:iron-sulfur cluster repair protein YtfE (RIC family)